MDHLEQARECLARTVDELKKCGTAAFSDMQIDEAGKIGSWIKVLQGLYTVSAAKTATPASLHPGFGDAAKPAVPNAKPVRLSRSNKAEYPRFYRSGDDLVKVGWSKTERDEYEHKAPKEAVDATAAGVAQVGAGGREFTASELFAQSAVSGLPQYQVYLALAWFRAGGLVEQIGKQGYRWFDSGPLDTAVATVWHALASDR